MRLVSTALAIAMMSSPLAAQDRNPFEWSPSHQKVADHLGTGLVGGVIVADIIQSIKSPNTKRELGCDALRLGTTVAAAETTKHLVHKWRPNHQDRKSFYSEHTALMAASSFGLFRGKNQGWSFALTFGEAYLRGAANMHDVIDTGVGGAAGFFASRWCS